MGTSPQACTTPNDQLSSDLPNQITQSPSSPNAGSGTEGSSNGLDLLSSVCANDAYSPSIQIYDDSLTSQAPVLMSSTQAIVPAITQTSPGNNWLPTVALFQGQASKKRQCSTTCKHWIEAQILEGDAQFKNFNDALLGFGSACHYHHYYWICVYVM